ncbi:CG3288 [Drosophila busckii]|uniref:CG3288 n=1 Tax=Drosophila busckii TaxID=30019 RepID=A0A0M4EDA4_DROBS|nr:uncharacterized protein LOC108600260 [Drosophila busckii]ALC43546.1 CG3288 [Drosophila busckii]
MLLDAIIWLPTLFTYLFFLFILIILFFIVAYVSHKIYISIYDNLPLPAAPNSRSLLSMRSEQLRDQPSARTIWIQNRSQIYESTAVRAVLSLEPCYLVSVELDIYCNPKKRNISFMCNCEEPVDHCAATSKRESKTMRVLKHYDHLSQVPRLKVLMRCSERQYLSNMRYVLDDVINDVKDAQDACCSDNINSEACKIPEKASSRRSTAVPKY